MSIFQAVGTAKGTNRKAACGPVPGTDTSAKKFFCSLGAITPKDQEIGSAGLTQLGKAVGIRVIAEKGHVCDKGEVKLSSVKGWYRWGHPAFPDEGGKVKSQAYLKLPQVILDKIKPLMK